MALKLADRVRETTTSTGTGTFTLAGAMNGFQSFSAIMAVGDTTYYSIVAGAQWETGIGTFGAGNTLARTTVIESSTGGSKVNFAAGVKYVFVTLPGTRAPTLDGNGKVALDYLSFATQAQAEAGTATGVSMDPLRTAQAIAAKRGVANGLASLDASGRVPVGQLNLTGYAKFYTGTTQNETDLPIGSIVLVSSSDGADRNGNVNVKLGQANDIYDGRASIPTTLLSGTWRSRGRTGTTTLVCQRVA